MFYSTTDGQYINEGQAFTINDVQYPQNWLNLSTPDEKTAIGLEEVIATNSPKDDRYYWVSQTLDKATLTYINTPKDLVDVQKTAITQVNQAAYSILLPTDWLVIMSTETGSAMDPAWKTWRAAIRTQAANAVTAINTAIDVDGVASAVQVQWTAQPITPPM